MTAAQPDIHYFCELDSQPLQDLFNQPEVLEFLQSTHATLSLGIIDLSEQRARVVQALNQAGVPVTAWLLLPRDQGYWLNLDNALQAAMRYEEFKQWSREYHLQWARIGLDIEPDLRTTRLLATHRLSSLWDIVRRWADRKRLAHGARAYRTLVEQIHQDSYPVETYQIPLIADERQAHSKFFQRTVGLVDLPNADREILMLYSSFTRPWGEGILWSYAPAAQGIGIGITGKGMEQESAMDVRPMNWAELETDLLLARQCSNHLYIFSLEGCVQQNFLPLLKEFPWQKPVEIPYSAAQRAETVRGLLRRGLWLLEHPSAILFGLALLVSAVTLAARRARR